MKNIISLGLSSIAVIIAIVALCNIVPRQDALSWDYLGILVGILSFLVTALLGWQIFSVITVEKRLKDLSDLYANISSKSDEIEERMRINDINIEAQLRLRENSFYFNLEMENEKTSLSDFANSYIRFMECLPLFMQVGDEKCSAFCLINGDDALTKISEKIKNGEHLDPNFDNFCDQYYNQCTEFMTSLNPDTMELLHNVRARRKSLRTKNHLPKAVDPRLVRKSPNRV